MARCTTIWTVFNDQTQLVAGFTVRHEMVTWLQKQESLVSWLVVRLPDNPSRYKASPSKSFPAEVFL